MEVISFFSLKLNAAQINYSTIEKELYAMVYALKKFGHIVRRSELESIVVTDHSNLTAIEKFQMRRKRNSTGKKNFAVLKYELFLMKENITFLQIYCLV
jgi:RNase H-like domain found in reverse transcriptase